MKVKLLCNLGTSDYPVVDGQEPFLEGTEHEVSTDLGVQMLRCRHAINITPAKPVQEPLSETSTEATAPAAPAVFPRKNKEK